MGRMSAGRSRLLGQCETSSLERRFAGTVRVWRTKLNPRGGVKRRHVQSDLEVQPWRTEEFRSLEATFERRECGFHPRVLRYTFRSRREEKLCCSSKRSRSVGRTPQQACATMFFLIPTNVTSERTIALLLPWISWWAPGGEYAGV